MVKYREIIRLGALGVSKRNIAFSCQCALSTVQSVLTRAKAHGLEWPLPAEMGDAAIRSAIYPPKDADDDYAGIDHEHVADQLLKRGVTMLLLWNEYCDGALLRGEKPLMYSAFCSRHRKWAESHGKPVMRVERKPGEEMQVDWVGDTMEVADPDTGEMLRVFVFVACLPFSSKLFAEGFYSMDEESWITAHVHAFSFFGGTTPILVPDNCKTAVIRSTVEELIVNDQYRRMAEYYGCAVVPARPRKPRDKAAVEMGVGIVERQAIAALRNRAFLSLQELNDALAEKTGRINERPFQKREGSRESVFLGQEKQTLVPLPAHPYEIVIRKHATVNFNYHVAFDHNWYSVPFNYVRREVEVAATKSTVAIIADGERIAIHERVRGRKGAYSTNRDHMPDAHRDYVQWSGERFRRWASEFGPATERCVDAVLRSRQVEQQSYRSARALIGLGEKHGAAVVEEACRRSLELTANPSYKLVKSKVSKVVDEISGRRGDDHAYLRGAEYYKDNGAEGAEGKDAR